VNISNIKRSKNIFNQFFSKPDRSVVYLLVAFPWAFIALMGIEYGAFSLYMIPVVICITQFCWPTMIGWWLVFLPCVVVSIAGGCGLFFDLVKIMLKERPEILLDFDDSVFFLVGLAVFFGLCCWLWRVQPGASR
jgi:hypothetical protein